MPHIPARHGNRRGFFWKVGAWVLAVSIVTIIVGAALMFIPTITTTTAQYPYCADTKDGITLDAANPTGQIPLHMECWSGWVNVPPDKDFDVNNGVGDLEYLFLDGKRIFVPGNETRWLGKIRYSAFHLRGGGTARITIDATAPPSPASPSPPPTPPSPTPAPSPSPSPGKVVA